MKGHASGPGTTVLLVPHTHWDRAWYWPFERFRGKLLELWDILLREFDRVPGYCYTCDGQTAMVEDFLEVRPDCREKVAALARRGALVMGPCYVQPDSYLTGAEAQIRNVLCGLEFARELGGEAGVCKTFHLPDTFGIAPEQPALVAGLGFEAFSFMRGHPGETPGLNDMNAAGASTVQAPPRELRMFWWESADGARVRVFRLRDGYANARGVGPHWMPGMPSPDAEAQLATLMAAARKQDDAQGEPLLLLAGGDHCLPPTGAPPLLARANAGGEFRFRWATLSELATALAEADAGEWPTHRGEFHGTGAASVLGGTISARIYLKQANAAVERLLTHGAEPLHAAAAFLDCPDPASPILKTTWKTLLKSHQHDSICGCSVDAVHRVDEVQFTVANEAGDGLRRRGFNRLFLKFGMNRAGDARGSFALFNPQALPVRSLSRYTCDFEGLRQWGDLALPDHYSIVNEQGDPVPFREVRRGRSVEHPHPFATLELCPQMAGGSFARFYIQPASGWPATPLAAPHTLENSRLRAVVCGDGSLEWTDKASGRRWRGLGYFSVQADAGDSYDFADDPGRPERCLRNLEWVIKDGGGCNGLQRVSATATLETPSGQAQPVQVEWLLAESWRHVEVRIQFTNQAPDWRLRWNMAFQDVPVRSRAGLKFNEVCRGIGAAPPAGAAPRIHPEHPADHFVAAEFADGSGVGVFSEFPVNYEVCRDEGTRLAVTVLRAVGWLCNPVPLSTRPGNHAGPHTATPDAQCLGRPMDLRFALRPFTPGEASELFLESALWRTPPIGGQCDATMAHPERNAEAPARDPEPLYKVEGDALFVAAFKPPHTLGHNGVVLRLARLAPEAGEAVLTFSRPVEVEELNLAEEQLEAAEHLTRLGPASFRIQVRPWSLRTLRIE